MAKQAIGIELDQMHGSGIHRHCITALSCRLSSLLERRAAMTSGSAFRVSTKLAATSEAA
jgi:hypothetical protein